MLFVGMLSGTYSSIFIATPVLADLKEREPQYKDLATKVNRRLAGGRAAQRGTAEAGGATAAAAAAQATAATTTATATAVSAATGTAPGTPADQDQDTDDAVETGGGDGVAVPAAARTTGDTPSRQVSRQQRVTGGTQRRPGAKKKRR